MRVIDVRVTMMLAQEALNFFLTQTRAQLKADMRALLGLFSHISRFIRA